MDNSITETKKEMEQLRDELKEMKKIVEELQNDRPSEESFNQFRNELNSFKQPLQQICNGMNIAFEGFKGIQKHLCGANDIPKSTIQATAANGERKMSDSVAEESWKKLANIAKDLNSDDQLRALQQACRITNQFRNVKHFSENRFVSIFVESLNSENDEVKFVAAKALSNIAQGTPEQIKSFIDSDAIPALIGLLDLSCLRVREQALEALANITYVERESRYHCLERGLLKKLNKLACRQPSLQCMQNIAKILANFTVNNHPLAISEFVKEVTPQIIPVLRTLIHHYDTDVLYKTCIALYYLAGYGYFDIIIENGFIQKVVNLFSHSSVKVSKTVYYVFIEMVKFINSDRIEYLIDNGILEYMKEPLMESDEKIQEITVSLFSKITASTLCNIQAVIDAGFIPLFIQLLNHDNPETRAEIIYIIFNIVNGGSEANIQYLLNFDIIGLLCKFKEDGTYHETVGALHTLFIILTRIGCRKQLTCQKMNDCGGTDKIRELQTHGQDKIQYFSSLIISQFFTSPFLKDEDVEIL
uniref:Importin subunit alpha n=1 Tax=Panagrolaimus superbus TaxID=310955 RepID=A0A914YHU0_9BILA